MRTLKEALKKSVNDWFNAKGAILLAVQTIRNELNQILDELENTTKKELYERYHARHEQLITSIETVNVTMQDLESRSNLIKSTEYNISQQFVMANLSKKDICLVSEMINGSFAPSSEQLTFSENLALKDFLKRQLSLGHIGIRQGLYTVRESSKCNVKADSESIPCYITGVCILQSEALLLTDYTNNKLNLFYFGKSAIARCCKLSARPLAVAIVTDAEVAVSLDNKTIQFVAVCDKLLPTRLWRMDHECFGLAIVGNNMYITTGSKNDTNIYVHALNEKLFKKCGKVKMVIGKDHSGKQIFSDARHVAVSSNGNIHVADRNNGLTTVDTQGQVLWKFSRDDLKEAYGVCTDCYGNVFVCGINSHNVLQLGQDWPDNGRTCFTIG